MSNKTTRICPTHGETDFYFKITPKRVKFDCCLCKKEREQKRQHRIKKQCVDYLGGICSVCKKHIHQSALEFHHKDPSTKEFEINQRKLCSFETLKPELDKCVLVCVNCHRKQHITNKDPKRTKVKQQLVELKGNKCLRCNESFYGSMDFHHLNPLEKDFTIGNHSNLSFEVLSLEVAKCIMLCGNCHREEHYLLSSSQ